MCVCIPVGFPLIAPNALMLPHPNRWAFRIQSGLSWSNTCTSTSLSHQVWVSLMGSSYRDKEAYIIIVSSLAGWFWGMVSHLFSDIVSTIKFCNIWAMLEPC